MILLLIFFLLSNQYSAQSELVHLSYSEMKFESDVDFAAFYTLQVMCFLSLVIMQVVGGIDEQIPSLPSSTGVKVVTYSTLLNQVILIFPMNPTNSVEVLGDHSKDIL